MIDGKRWSRGLVLAATLLLLASGIALAQSQTGNVYGSVHDNKGNHLPGVTVTLSGIGAPQVQVTDENGNFRFLGLSPGTYKVKAALEGFSTVENTEVGVNVGRNTTLEVELTPAVEEVITVTSEAPLLDERKVQTGTTVTQVELEKIPTSRDPWSLLNQAPGVQVDRINVGGNESGQQSVFEGEGVASTENAFSVDGVTITDMAALGSSPTYYDFDAFSEVQLSTGGSDITVAAAGVNVNLVTKRGTNEWKGSGRYYLTDNAWQSNTGLSKSDLTPTQAVVPANEIQQIKDYGAELGGPIVKDRLWIWGAYGDQKIDQNTFGGDPDNTELENYNAKLNAQIATSNSAIGQWSRGDKIKNGRGAGPTRSAETTWNQSGPTEISKIEDTHIFSSSFFLTGLYSYVNGGFALAPKAGTGPSAPDTTWDANGVWRGGFLDFSSDRNVDQWKLDGSYFFNTGQLNHELKFGGSFRHADTTSTTIWGGRSLLGVDAGFFGTDPASGQVLVAHQQRNVAYSTDYSAYWAQDTLTSGNLTVNVGVRYDQQDGKNKPSMVPADPTFPDLLPAKDFQGNNAGGFSWDSISPRVSATYALGQDKKTLLRASFSRFAQQLGQGLINRVNPLGYVYAYFYFQDTNGNLLLDPGEQVGDLFYPYGFDPANPSKLESTNINDKNLKPETTDEVVLGFERSLLPQFVVGLNLTYRNTTDVEDFRRLIQDENGNVRVATANDYVLGGTVSGTLDIPNGKTISYNEPYYILREGLSPTGGFFLTNGDRSHDYKGASIIFTKRLENRWMLRGNFTFADTSWDIPSGFRQFDDPTNLVDCLTNRCASDDNGGIFGEQSGGSGTKGGIFLNSKWSFNVNGLYQVAPDRPWGFNVAANISGRQGFPDVVFHRVTGDDGISRDVQITKGIDTIRNDDIFTFDAHLDKDFTFGDWGATLSVDGFNLTNAGYILQRQGQQNTGSANDVQEVLSPRIFRLGLRLHFK